MYSDTNENSKISSHGGIDIRAICVEFCTDEERYNVKDSHFIQIPQEMYQKFLQHKNVNEPLYIGISKSGSFSPDLESLYFGRVEPSIRSANSSIKMCLLPGWIMDKLNIDRFDGLVDIVLIREELHIKKLGYIKIKGNISSYVSWDNIRERLEDKLSQYNCINLGDILYIDDVIFTVTELKDLDDNIVRYGSTFNTTVNLDFEVPDDLREKELKRIEDENKRKEESDRLKLERKEREDREKREKKEINKGEKINRKEHKFGAKIFGFDDLANKESIEEKTDEGDKKEEHFKGQGNKLTSNTDFKPPTREERVKMIQERLLKEKMEIEK